MSLSSVDLNQKATSRETVLLLISLAIVMGVFLKGVHGPQLRRVVEFKQKTTALRLEREALKKFSLPALDRGTAAAAFSKTKGIKAKILTGELKPAFVDVPTALSKLTEPVFLQGVIIQNISYQPPSAQAGVIQTDFNLNIRGTFVEVLRYLERLEKFPALFVIRAMDVKTVEGQTQEINADLSGRFYELGSLPATDVQKAAQKKAGG